MSVDMIMYRVNKLAGRDLIALSNAHYDEIDNLCPDEDWEYKAYLKIDVDENPDRFSEILKYMRPMTLRRTITDYKQCYIDHGMPADTSFYSCSHHSYEIVLRWDNNMIRIPKDKREKYTHEEETEYYVTKRQNFDGDVSNYMARTLIKVIEAEFGGDYSYRPCQLNKSMAERLTRAILKEYDNGEIYSIDEMMSFIMELMRTFVDSQKRLFIEFQD